MLKNTCLKILRTVSLAAGALICLSLSACDNFMDGGLTKEDIQQEIENYIGTSTVITLHADSEKGTMSPAGLLTLRAGMSVELEFQMNSQYKFRGFEVSDPVTGNFYKDAVSFSEPAELPGPTGYTMIKTTLTVLKNNMELDISPLCTRDVDDVPPVISNCITAGTRTDVEAGNNNYQITNNLSVCVMVNESDSTIEKLYVSEDNSTFMEIGSDDYLLRKYASGYYKFYFDYALTDTSGGEKQLYVQVRDAALNNSQVYPIKYYQDTIADVNFYLTNPTVNYTVTDYHTVPYVTTYSDDTNNVYENVINVKIAQKDIEARQWSDEDSNVMTFSLYAGKEYSPGKNGNNLYTKPADLKWSYSYSSDRDELDSKAMTDMSFAGAVEAVYDSTWYKQLSIPVEGSDKVTYIKIRCQDLSGNLRDAYYELPSLPETVSKFITTYNADDRTYKSLRVKSRDSDNNGYYFSLIYAHTVNYLTDWRAFGEDYRPSSGSALVQGDLTWTGNSDYDSLTSANFYSQLVYKYYDYSGKERYIYGYVSDLQTTQDTTIANYALSPDVVISADTADTHTITVTIPQNVYDYYDSVYAYAEGVFSCFFDEGRTKSFKVATSNFYEPLDTTTRKAFKFYVVGVKDGVERSSAYPIYTNNSYIHDNVAPRVLYADSLPKDNTNRIPFDYTGKYIKVKVDDTGDGFPSEQDITVRYVTGDYDVTRKIKFYSSDDAIYIPVGHLPLAKYWSSFDISFSFKDAGSITTDCSFSYTDPRYYPYFHGDLNKWEYWNAKPYCYDESDINYSIVYENSSYQFRFIPGIESYLDESPSTGELVPIMSRFGNMFMGKVQASYDKISSSGGWLKGCEADYMETKYTGATPWYEYLTINSATTGFFRFFIQASSTNTRIGPIYLYQTGEQTVSIKDVVNTVNGMQVYSSKPFFIHTLWSEFNYGDDPKDWEYHCTGSGERSGDQKMEVNVKFLNSSSYSSSPYYYPILTEDVPDGCYYCAVVWFADNTCIMSTVRQK